MQRLIAITPVGLTCILPFLAFANATRPESACPCQRATTSPQGTNVLRRCKRAPHSYYFSQCVAKRASNVNGKFVLEPQRPWSYFLNFLDSYLRARTLHLSFANVRINASDVLRPTKNLLTSTMHSFPFGSSQSITPTPFKSAFFYCTRPKNTVSA